MTRAVVTSDASSVPRDPVNRDVTIKVRVKPEDRTLMEEAADEAGLSLSAWVRMVALKAAKKERK